MQIVFRVSIVCFASSFYVAVGDINRYSVIRMLPSLSAEPLLRPYLPVARLALLSVRIILIGTTHSPPPYVTSTECLTCINPLRDMIVLDRLLLTTCTQSTCSYLKSFFGSLELCNCLIYSVLCAQSVRVSYRYHAVDTFVCLHFSRVKITVPFIVVVLDW
jgi:hypothetical protein